MKKSLPRVLIVCDGKAWFIRHVHIIEHCAEPDWKIYYCDMPIGGRFKSLAAAVKFLRVSQKKQGGAKRSRVSPDAEGGVSVRKKGRS